MKKIKFQTPTKEQWKRGAINAAGFAATGGMVGGAFKLLGLAARTSAAATAARKTAPVVKNVVNKATPVVKDAVKKMQTVMKVEGQKKPMRVINGVTAKKRGRVLTNKQRGPKW